MHNHRRFAYSRLLLLLLYLYSILYVYYTSAPPRHCRYEEKLKIGEVGDGGGGGEGKGE